MLRDAAGVGLATGAYGLSFGAISSAAGLSVLQTCVLSLVMFTGGSQFAMVGVIGGGGAAMTGAATAIMLGVRNAFYAVRMAGILDVRGWRRPAAAQLTIDESTAMAVARATTRSSRLAFWATGLSVYVCWNLATLIGALSAQRPVEPAGARSRRRRSRGLPGVDVTAFAIARTMGRRIDRGRGCVDLRAVRADGCPGAVRRWSCCRRGRPTQPRH